MPTNKTVAEPALGEITELPRVDEAIAEVERLYESLTGSPPPPAEAASSPLPVEKDAAEAIAERLDRLLEALGQPAGHPGETPWSPPITVWEDGAGLLLRLEVPGVSRRDLQLLDDGDSLTVTGRRAAANDGMRLRLTERPLGPFQRKILLPRGASGGELSARLHDGVLEIHIPKPATGAGGPHAVPVS
jgi:HSP20 family protein